MAWWRISTGLSQTAGWTSVSLTVCSLGRAQQIRAQLRIPSATEPLLPPLSFAFPLCEMGSPQPFPPPVYKVPATARPLEMPVSGPQPQPLARTTRSFPG